jgi:hypothetical protein
MGRVKTAYREKPPHVPVQGTSDLPGQMDIPLPETSMLRTPIAETTPEPKTEAEPSPRPQAAAQPQAAPPQSAADDPTAAFQRVAAQYMEAKQQQIEAARQQQLHQEQQQLRQEQLQRFQQLSPREQVLEVWKQSGISETESAFFAAHPSLLDHPKVTQQAIALAMEAGHQRGSDTINQAVLHAFDRLQALIAEQQQAAEYQPEPQAAPPQPQVQPLMSTERPPKAFSPLPPPAAPRIPVSAPVTPRVPSADRNPVSSQVRLTAEEREIARMSNMTDEEYALQKRRLMAEKRQGFHQ